MKSSFIDWCPKVPDHWDVVRLKDIATLKSGDSFTAEMLVEDGEYPVYGGNGLRGYYSAYTHEGDYVLIGRQGALCGNINYAHGKFFATEHALVVTPIHDEEIVLWLGETLRTADYNRLSESAAQPGLSAGNLLQQLIPYPPKEERMKIASYLSEKIASINSYISARTKEIELLKTFKLSKINEIVVRGLNREVDYKESGIDWLGNIPCHWKVRRIKDIFYESSEVTAEGEEDLLSVSEYYGVAKRKDRMDDDEEFESRAESLEGYKVCHKGDLVSNIMLTWKRALGVSDYDGIVSPAYGVYRGIDIFPKYYHYLLRSDMYIAEFKRNSTGIIDSRLRLYSDKFFSIHTIYPPLSEQQEIANYLDIECEKIDRKCALIEQQIEKLQLLKRALINEVVTGKRRIA